MSSFVAANIQGLTDQQQIPQDSGTTVLPETSGQGSAIASSYPINPPPGSIGDLESRAAHAPQSLQQIQQQQQQPQPEQQQGQWSPNNPYAPIAQDYQQRAAQLLPAASRQASGGVKGILQNFFHGMGSSMMTEAGLTPPDVRYDQLQQHAATMGQLASQWEEMQNMSRYRAALTNKMQQDTSFESQMQPLRLQQEQQRVTATQQALTAIHPAMSFQDLKALGVDDATATAHAGQPLTSADMSALKDFADMRGGNKVFDYGTSGTGPNKGQWLVDKGYNPIRQLSPVSESGSARDLQKQQFAQQNAALKAQAQLAGKTGYLERPDGTVWIGNEAVAKENNLPFEAMKPGDINKDKQAMRQLNDVQLNTSRYTHAAAIYANPNTVLTYRGKPVSSSNPVQTQGLGSIIGLTGTVSTPEDLRARDNTNLNTLMNNAGWADMSAAISHGGHIELPIISAFSQSLSRQINSRAYAELSDQGKELYDGYVRTMSAIPAYQKALTQIGRSNKEMLDLELANIAHPGMAPSDIVRKQGQFQENIDRAADGFPRNMVGIKHPAQTRREVEAEGQANQLPSAVGNVLNNWSAPQTSMGR
jgi:hypothetical protein